MLHTAEELRGGIPLRSLPRILPNESVNYVDLIPLRYSRRLGSNIVSLEDAYRYMTYHNTDLTSFVEEVSHVNSLDYSNMIFSVQPASIYTNSVIREMYINLQEQNVPIYLQVDYNSREYKFFDIICEECIRQNSTKLFDQIFNEGFFSGAAEGAENGVLDMFAGIANAGLEKVRSNYLDRGGEYLDQKIGEKLGIDKQEKIRPYDPKTGGPGAEKTIVVKNAGLMDKIKGWKIWNKGPLKNNPNFVQGAQNFLTSAFSDVREGLSRGVLDQIQNLVGVDPNKPFDIRQVINTISNRISNLRSRPGSGGGVLTSLINKLIALKNKLVSALGGRR